jgi:hypothetical protein
VSDLLDDMNKDGFEADEEQIESSLEYASRYAQLAITKQFPWLFIFHDR